MQNTRKFLPLLLASLCGLLVLSACGKKSSSSGSSSSGSGDKAGNEAIGFHNKLVDFNKLAREPLKKIMQTTGDSASWVSRDGVTAEKPRWNMVLIGVNPYDKLAKNNLAAPGSFSKEDREFFDSRIKLAKDSAAELNKAVGTLTNYYKAGDYKDDKHKKFLDLKPRIEELVQQIARATGEMGERSEVIASAAEREALKKNPIGIYILNMRDIMAKCEQQMDILMDQRLVQVGSGTGSKTDEQKAEAVAKVKDLLDPAEALSKEIADMAEKFKAVDMGALKNRQTLAKDYENFFKILDEQQGTVRKNIRFAKEWGYIGTESSMKLLGGTVRKVTGAHNTFIGDVNKGR
ncbi:hypothetical protein M2103_001557 [Ereboglobus sp. PH5-5]|uniref:hypothetical protein n=1 Tax=unclassified Ereboglobus TaxID=2626932 RepID=UPI002404F103|nr:MULTISPECIES: hypothetical protein [unclassified Ereboglobus]MDF9828262.1 hypothetical protein [Ereboglobus sp. PH5-10]MDF9833334.1 hypothetical protein [Ereboglobus sp. PH5-5]